MELDPDYAFDISQDSIEEDDRTRQLEESAREIVKVKIKGIIKKQFSEAIAAKEREVTLITERLSEARHVLDRLRACVVASYYASSFAKPQEKHSVELGAAHHPAIQNVLRKAATAVLSRNAPLEHKQEEQNDEADFEVDSESAMDQDTTESKEIEGVSKMNESDVSEGNGRKSPQKSHKSTSKENLGGRHRIKKTIIVGNVSKYIAPDKREGNDKSTHKWMVYVRGSSDEPRIDHFVRKVWFFLHPSYRPNDLVEVSEAPFHLTRRGWGEFPVRVQLHFCDPRNRRVDIIHNLRLDRTYTGLQTLGAETVCEVELDRSTVGLPVENLLNQPVTPMIPDIDGNASDSDLNDKLPTLKTNDVDISKETSGSHLSTDVSDVVRDVVDEIVNKISSEVAKFPPLVEEMGVDPEEELEKEADLSSSFCAEKKRRRRRGDSCCVFENDENRKSKPMAMVLLCSDEEMDDDNLDDKDSLPSNVGSSPGNVEDSEQENLKGGDAELAQDAVDEALTDDKVASKSPSCSQDSNEPCTSDHTSASTRSSPEKIQPQEESLELNQTQVAADRQRSLSVDSAPSPVSLSFVGGKLVRIGKSAASSRDPVLPGGTPNKPPSPSVVLLRSRASSTGFASQKFSQMTKGNVTILTPIGSQVAKSPTFSGRKRPIGNVAASPSGRIVLNVVPEKKQKLTKQANPGSRSNSPNKITLSLNTNKQQKLNLQLQDVALRGGMSGTTTVRRTNVKLENSSKKDAKSTKSYILKNTKQGLIVVGQNVVGKESPQQQVVQSLTKTPNIVSAKQTFTDALTPSSDFASQFLQTADGNDKTKGYHRSGLENKDNQEMAAQGKTSTQDAQVGQSKQQHVNLKALKNAIMSSGIGVNRPVQIKIEKSGSQSLSQLKNNQQYVLTTVTNEQGKQQLALVSADKMRQSKGHEKTLLPQDSPSDQAPFLFKLDSEQSTWNGGKLINQGNRPFHEVIANKILSSSTVSDLVKDALPLAVKYVPLVAKEANAATLPFCAKSEAEFLEWNIGKQRASEMQRASLIQKILKHIRDRSRATKTREVPSKKSIMNWCLMRGHSVFTDEYESPDLDVGADAESAFACSSTLSSHSSLLKTLQENSTGIPNTRNEECVEVDVLSVAPPRQIKNEPQSQDDVSERTKYRFARTDEMKTVDKMTQEIGLKLSDIPLTDDTAAPLCQLILGKAMELFTSQLARETLASALMRRDGGTKIQRVLPERVDCRDVADAIQNNDVFQPFSDKLMAVSNDLDNTS